MDNIVLCGFMGCGKTTVGKELASLLDRQFVDMDRVIELNSGKTVSDIFSELGEDAFRGLETEVARELSSRFGLVIATGGGAVLRPQNVEAFRTGGRIVFIDVPIEVIRRRLEGDDSRPLLRGGERQEAMERLYRERTSIYRAAADLTVCNETDVPAALMALEIARRLFPDRTF